MTDAPAVIDNQGRQPVRAHRERTGGPAHLPGPAGQAGLAAHRDPAPVPQGRGIGSALVRAAIERAEREHLTVVVYCPFARSWLEQHPAEASRVTVESARGQLTAARPGSVATGRSRRRAT